MKILVVDDSLLNLNIAKNYLEDIPDLTDIFLCDDPVKAKSIIDHNDIDILMLDIIMPEITGIDLLKQLRSDSKYDEMLIIMLTSLDDTDSYKTCFELGAFDYINKPINDIEFNARMKVAIESKNNSNNLKSLIEVTQKQNAALKEMNAKLTEAKFNLVQSEKMAAIGQLAAGIAHEINNPMGYVNSNFETLQVYFNRLSEFLALIDQHLKDPVLLENQEFFDAVKPVRDKYLELRIAVIMNELDSILFDSANGIQRVTEIVQSLRVFARPSKIDEKNTCILLNLIKQVLLISKNEVKYVAKVELDVPDDIILYCNQVQIGQVFVNILVNSAQAIRSQNRSNLGTIKIYVRKVREEILIKFTDDGPGIPKEYLSKIFDPFFTTKEIGQGTGLGLSISYDIVVNKHHGLIEVQSELGKGAVFTILLPIVTLP